LARLNSMVRIPRLHSGAGRVIEWAGSLARVPPAGLRTGLGGRRSDVLPVVLLVQRGADESAVRRTVAAIPVVYTSASVRIVMVLDRPHLAIVRRAGMAVELLPDRAALEGRYREESWSQLAEHRLDLLREAYAAVAIVRVPSEGLSTADIPMLAARLRSDPNVHRGRVFWRRALATLIARLDPPVERTTRNARRSWRGLRGPR
jgi:hypothetical protein